jgi:hypothetical protein
VPEVRNRTDADMQFDPSHPQLIPAELERFDRKISAVRHVEYTVS